VSNPCLDIQRIAPKIRVGGIVVLDDIFWVGGAILRGIDYLQESGFVEIYRNTQENWNMMRREK